MSYISVDFDESRRCAAVIDSLAEKVGALIDGEDCELCHMLEAYASKLRVLASDLLETTEKFDALDAHARAQSARAQFEAKGRQPE
jgi:hypothetical protein